MRKHLLGLAIALATLIVAVSVWVVISSFQKNEAEPVKTDVSTTENKQTEDNSIVRNKTFEERMRSGVEFLALENFEQAENELAAAAVLEPNAIEPLLNLVEAQVQLKEFERARANLVIAEQLDATNSDIFILRGIIFLRENDFLEAEKAFSKAGDSADFWSGAMAAFFDRRAESEKLLNETTDARGPEIISAFTEYDEFPDSPKTHLDTLLARAFIAIGEYEMALAKIGPVLEDDSNYRDAWIMTGYAQFAQQKFELARESWQTAYALDPGKAETQYFIGLANFELKNWNDTEKFLLLARENNFEANDLDEKLIEVYLTSGKYRAAAEFLSEKIDSNPSASIEEFTRTISLYLEKLDDGSGAWELADLAVKRFPNSGEAWNLAGWVSLANGYLVEGRTQLEKSIKLDPSSPWPYYNLGRLFEKSNNSASALTAYHDAFDLDPEGPAGALAGQNYNRLLVETNPSTNE